MKNLLLLLCLYSLSASAQCPTIEGRAQNFYNDGLTFPDAFQVSVAPVDVLYSARWIEVTVDGYTKSTLCPDPRTQACPVYYYGMHQSPWSFKSVSVKSIYYTDSSVLDCPLIIESFLVHDPNTAP